MKKEVVTLKGYKNAFKCRKCPQSNDEKGCPVWWEQVWEEEVTKEQVLTSGCGFVLAQNLILDVVKQGFGARAEVNEMRKEVVNGVEQATVKMLELQRAKEEAFGSSNVEGYNLDALRLVRDD